MGLRVKCEQRTVVVQHFFEMRNLPVAVDGVSAKTATNMVVNAAFGHARQRQRCHEERIDVRRFGIGGAAPVPHQAIDRRRVRELGCAAKAAEVTVETLGELGSNGLNGSRAEPSALCGGRRLEAPKNVVKASALFTNLVLLFIVVAGDALQQLAESRHPVAALFGKVSAAEERPLVIGVQKHRQRPAATPLREQLVRCLIDPVDVRALFAIDLDIDELPVHEFRRGVVLERFVRHDVTPVTGRVADGQQYRLAGLSGQLEGLRTPGVPVHWIICMLQEIGTGFFRESVTHRFISRC